MKTNREIAEAAAAEKLRMAGIMLSEPSDTCPNLDLRGHWGVYAGSHGGHAKTLKTAMHRCLKCCDIGAWWRIDCGKGERMEVLFRRVAKKYLGGWPYLEMTR